MTYDQIFNPFFWVAGNFFLLVMSIGLLFYVIFYCFWFRWYEHGGGRLIMAFTSSLLGVVFLILVGLIANPAGAFAYPIDNIVWRPLVRAVVYGVICSTILSLDFTLIRRYRTRALLEFAVEPRPGAQMEPLPADLENTSPVPRKRRVRR